MFAPPTSKEPSLLQVPSVKLREKLLVVRPRCKGQKPPVSLNWARMEAVAHLPLNTAAGALGICSTALKNACRKIGVHFWPHRTFVRRTRERQYAGVVRKT